MERLLLLKVCAVAAMLVSGASTASANTAVSPTLTMSGSYTVSWTETSGGVIRAYLAESVNGGGWAKTTVTGTSSKAFTGKAIGTYAYKVQIYEYDYELRQEVFQYETNSATVQVIAAGCCRAPPMSA